MTPRGEKVRANGEGSVFSINTPSGKRWKAETTIGYDEQGKRIVASGTGATKTLAIERREANRLKILVLQGKAPASTLKGKTVKVRKQTVGEYLELWMKGMNPAKVGASTRRSYESKVALHINPHIGDIPLVLLERADIRKLFYETLPTKAYDPKNPEKRLSGGAMRNVWKPLYKALTEAVEDGLIAKHPMHGVDKPVEQVSPVEVDTARPRQLLTYLEGNADQAKWLTTFLLGLRISEKLGLTWDCIDLEPKRGHPATIQIKQQLLRDLSKHGCGSRKGASHPCGKRSAEHCPKRITGQGLYLAPFTKTEHGKRTLPIPPNLAVLLEEHRERWEYVKDVGSLEWTNHSEEEGDSELRLTWEPLEGLENLVFTMPDAKPISHQTENDNWHRLCSKYGFTNSRGHISRHVTATMLAEAGVPPETAKLILGHSSERMTAFYTHLKATKHALEPLQNLELAILENGRTYGAGTY